MTRFQFNKFGLVGDPRGAHVIWKTPTRDYLAEVTGCYRNEVTGMTMLKVRHLCGDVLPDIAASAVHVLERRD